VRAFALSVTLLMSCVVGVPLASAQDSQTGGADPNQPAPQQATPQTTGGAQYGVDPAAVPPTPPVPGPVAQLVNGLAYPPAGAPPQVQQAIWAANSIQGKPYVFGGGHNRAFRASGGGYDCSGTVSYALHGGALLASPLDSGSFMHWGERGPGQWITVYTNPGHAFAIIAGLRLDTSAAGDPSGAKGPRWRPVLRSTRGYHARHPLGF
jgi:cell wall-associated NlpC family hydrolase